MTHRVYLRYPDQRVAHKTQTDSREVAALAFRHLVAAHVGEAAAVTWTEDGRNQQYIALDDQSTWHSCRLCNYVGPFIDDDECCPACAMVQ